MKVLRYLAPRQAEIVESTSPKTEGRVSVAKTIATQVSAGTEMAFYRGEAPQLNYEPNEFRLWEPKPDAITYPMKSDDPGVWWMGYSAIGRIVEVGPEETHLRKGDLVYSHAGHKEYVASDGFLKLPPETNPHHATLLTLLGTALNGLWDARVKLLDDVVIIGMGTIGHLLLQMCKLSGATVTVVDLLAPRLELAHKLGADAVCNPARDGDVGTFVRKTTSGRGADAVFEVSGNVKALPDAIRCAAFDGQVTILSFYQAPPDTLQLGREFHHNRVIVRSSQVGGVNPALGPSFGPARRLQDAVALLKLLDLEPLITHRVPFLDLPNALEMIDRHPATCLSLIVTYDKD